MAETGPVLAVDVGGTKLAAAVVLPSGVVLGASVGPTPQGADAETLWEALVALVRRVRASVGLPVVGAGVGAGGPMRWPDGVISPLNIPGWLDFPLRARLAAELGVPVRLHNDAVCAAVAEHWRGAGRGHSHMLGMVVSTGVGGGLVLGGRVMDGGSGNAGHVGHIVVDPDGPACRCGGRGCLEAVARGPAVVAWALHHGWTPAGPRPPAAGDPAGGEPARGEPARGEQVAADGPALAASARAGDPVALAAYERAGTMLGRGIASAVAALDLTAVVVGGGFAASGDLLFAPLRAAYARHGGLPYVRAARVLPAALGAETGLLGAAALVLAGDRYWSGD